MSAFTAFFVHKRRLSSRGVCTACPKPRVRAPVRRSVAPSVAAVVSPTPRTLKQTNLRQRTLSLTILTQRWCKQSTSTAVSSTVPVIASRVAAIARRASHNRACSTCHWPVLVQIIQFQPIPNGNLSKKINEAVMPCHEAGLYSTMSVVVVDRTSLLCPVAKSHLIAKRLKLLSTPENANRNQKVVFKKLPRCHSMICAHSKHKKIC